MKKTLAQHFPGLRKMMVHICPLDKECRDYGAPWRIYIRGPKRFYYIALRPSGKTQKSGTHWTEGKWVWFTWENNKKEK